jgi:hypothetical protein
MIDRNAIRRLVLREMHEMGMVQMDHAGRIFHNNGPEQESDMIRSNLFTVAQKAYELHDLIGERDDLPEWVQEKIAVVDSMMGSVFDYLMYEYHDTDGGSHDEIPLNEKKKNGRVTKGKYHGKTYKASAAMKKAIEKGASYEELRKMADWADNPDAVVNAALMAVKGKPSRADEGT